MISKTSRLLTVIVVALGIFAVACSGSDSSTEDDADVTSSSTTTASGDISNGDAASPTPALPDWVNDSLDDQEHVRYIANTGGVGVSHRSACQRDARLDGVWTEGTQLEIVLDSEAGCENWSLLSDGEVTSWVSNSYLSTTQPATRSTSSATTGGAATGGAATQIEVIDFFGHLIPVSQLRVKPLTYTYNNTVIISGCAASWHPIGDSIVTTASKVIADPDPASCGFGAVDLVPSYWVSP